MSTQEIEKSKWSNFPLHTEYENIVHLIYKVITALIISIN